MNTEYDETFIEMESNTSPWTELYQDSDAAKTNKASQYASTREQDSSSCSHARHAEIEADRAIYNALSDAFNA